MTGTDADPGGPGPDAGAGPGAPSRRATLAFVAALPLTVAAGLAVGGAVGAPLGEALEERLGGLLGTGDVAGRAAVTAACCAVLQLVVLRLVGARLDRATLRRGAAVAWVHGLPTFPLSGPFLVALAALHGERRRWRDRRPRLAAAARIAWYLGAAGWLLVLARWGNFHRDLDRVAFVAGLAAAGAALTAWPRQRWRAGLAAALALGVYLLVLPPQDTPPALRVLTAAVVALLAATPALLAGREGAPDLGAPGPVIGLAAVAMWAWWGVFLFEPSSAARERVAAQPGVEVLAPLGDPLPGNDNRWLGEACAPDRWIFASRERSRGLTELAAGRPPAAPLPFSVGYDVAVDCAAGRAYAAAFERGTIERLALGPLRALGPLEGVDVGSPTIVQMTGGGTHLYVMDDGADIHRVDLEAGHVDRTYRSCLPNGLWVDERAGLVHVGSCGWLRTYDVDSAALVGSIDLRRGVVLPFPLEPHFHRLTGDPETGEVFGAYLETDRLFRIDGRAAGGPTLLREERVGRGFRDLAFARDASDARVVYASNYVTGELIAVDADTLAPRGRVWIGPRIRSVVPSPDGRRVYATSAVGGVAVDAAALSPPP